MTDPSAAHRLPYTVEPVRYALRLAPDLEAATFTGEVRIEATAHAEVATITLHGTLSGTFLFHGRPYSLHPGVNKVHAP